MVDREVHVIGGPAQKRLDGNQLCGGAACTNFVSNMAHFDAAFRRDFKLRNAGFGARAKVFLYRAKADAVTHAGVGQFIVRFALCALCPQRIFGGNTQHFANAQMTRGRSALGVFHTAFHYIALAQFNRIQAQLLGDFIDQHFGIGHGLHRAVAAHGACGDANRWIDLYR